MHRVAIKDFKIGETFTLTPFYDENIPVYTIEKFIENGEIAICRDQNSRGISFDSNDMYYPIYFSSLDSQPYRD